MSTQGIDIRQTTGQILFRVSLKDQFGDKITSGTTELRVYRLEDDGTLDVYDWTTNDFVAPGGGTPDDETTMTHRQRRDSTGADVDTGIWTTVLSTLTNWTVGQVYIAQVTHSSASPESQEREFQFGGADGDMTVTAGNLEADAVAISGDSTAADNLEVVYDGVEGFAGAYAGPRGPGVYYNDAAGNANTVNGVDGTWNNPVSTIGAAKTIADSLSADRIYLINNSSATLTAIMEDYEFVGIGEMTANTVNFGSQDVDRSVFYNLLLTGAQGGTGRCQAVSCCLSSITGMEITALWSLIANAGSLTLRNDCAFAFCFSAVAGGDTPTLDINSVANVNVYFRHYSGGLQIDNAVATTVMSYEADGQLVVDASCTSLTIVPRGNLSVTDNGTTTNINLDAAINRTGINAEVVDVIRTDTPAELAAVPAANAPLHEQMQWLFQKIRNEETTTATAATISKDDGTAIGTSTLTDDGTTFTKGEYS